MSKKIVITGSAGFFGRYMTEYVRSLNVSHKIFGIDNREDKLCDKFFNTDISNGRVVSKIIAETKPDILIHLAGTFGTDDSQEIYRTNVLSMSALLDAVKDHMPECVVITAGSAAEYGRICTDRIPADETVPCKPVTPYGLSKLLATKIALYYCRVNNLKVSIVRLFQLIGKGVTSRLAPGAFFKQIRKAQNNGNNIIKVGNLESSRDFLDVRDAAAAVWMLCEKPAPGEIFNLCSGQPTKITDLLKMMINVSGAEVQVEIDPVRLRGKADVSVVYGSSEKLRRHCNWQPETSLVESIQKMFSFD